MDLCLQTTMSAILLRRTTALAASRGRVSSTLLSPIANCLASRVGVNGSVIPAAEFGNFSCIGVMERPSGFGFRSRGFQTQILNFQTLRFTCNNFKTLYYGKIFTLIKNILFSFQVDVGSHNPPHSKFNILDGTLLDIWLSYYL